MTKLIIGADEVGVGAYAGPITVCAFLTPVPEPLWWKDHYGVDGRNACLVKDSKKLTPAKRALILEKIQESNCIFEVESMSAVEVTRHGHANSIKELFTIVIHRIIENNKLEKGAYEVIVDGIDGMGLGTPVVRAESWYKEVAAASIVAKVIRDRYMVSISDRYPQYKFKNNKGYGTKEHEAALFEYGPCEEHRSDVRPVHEAASLGHKFWT